MLPRFCRNSQDDITITRSFVPKQSTRLIDITDIGGTPHPVLGDGSCLYHAVAHQAGLISHASRGEQDISAVLRQLARLMMDQYPAVREEDAMSEVAWEGRKQYVLRPASWGSDLLVRLLAIGLQQDIRARKIGRHPAICD